jgi:hypothetical protein
MGEQRHASAGRGGAARIFRQAVSQITARIMDLQAVVGAANSSVNASRR